MSDVQPVIDMTVIAALRELDPESDSLVVEVVALFLDDSVQQLEAVHAALARGAAQDVARAAHGLKNTALALGAARLSATCQAVELAARESLEAASAIVARLNGDLEEARSAVATLV